MGATTRYNNTDFVMFLRAIAINALAAAVVFLAYHGGWIAAVVDADTLYISRTIIGLGLLGMGMIMIRIFKVSRELNVARKYHQLVERDGAWKANEWLDSTNTRTAEFIRLYRSVSDGDKPILVEDFRIVMGSKISLFGTIVEKLVTLGFLGTVVGMRMGLGNIDPAAFRDFELLTPMIKLITGAFYIAIDTTIVGICMALWLNANLGWVLRPGAVQLVSESIKIGVKRNG